MAENKKYLDMPGLTYFYNQIKSKFASKTDVGTPSTASTIAAMTDHNKVYVYTGSETGYTYGNWYFYEDGTWHSGGQYHANVYETDKTLSVADKPADAKKTGDEIADLKSAVNSIEDAAFTEVELSDKLVTSGFRLTTAGLTETNNSYKLLRYPVEEGTVVKVISDDRFQFQSQLGVSSSPPSPRIGRTYDTYDGAITVPSGATHIALSTPVDNGIAYVGNLINRSDNAVRYDMEQALSEEQKAQARANMGAVEAPYKENVIYNNSASVEMTIFTSDDVNEGDHIIYDINLPVSGNNNYGGAGYLELLDSQNNRLGVYGRLVSTENAQTLFHGTFDIPEGFDRAMWSGTTTYATSNALSLKISTRTGDVDFDFDAFIRGDKQQNLNEDQQRQARENIGLESQTINTTLFSGSPTNNQILFDSDDVIVGDSVAYSIILPANTGNDYGALEVVDTNNLRCGLYGRPFGANPKNEFSGTLTIPRNFSFARWITNISGATSVKFDKITKEVMLFNENAIANRVLFDSSDVPGGTEVKYDFSIAKTSGGGSVNYPASFLAIYKTDGTRDSWYGKESGNNTPYANPYTGMFTLPDDFAYAIWQGGGTCYANYIKADVPLEYAEPEPLIDNPYRRFDLKKYGEVYNGYTHVAFPRMCAFDGKFVVVYRCGMRHRTEYGNGVAQIDTIDLGGKRTHIRTLAPSDFTGVTGTDARDFYCMSTDDGEHLILFGGFGKGTVETGYKFDLVLMALDKAFNIISYKVISESIDYPYGNMLITPQGKLIFSTFNQSLTDSAIYRSNEVFSDYVTNLSGLTFEKTTLFTTSNVGASSFSECCLGYFNDKLLIALRIEASANYTPFRVTEDLEGTSGWGNVIQISGVLSHSPVLLPHYRGRYLPYMCSRTNPSTGYRDALFAYIDLENNTFLCYEDIDKTLFTSHNGYPWFYNLGNEIYAVVYYQEALVTSDKATQEQSTTGLYYKWINTRVLFPFLNGLDMQETV